MGKYFKESKEEAFITASDYLETLSKTYMHDREEYYTKLMESVMDGSCFTKDEFDMFCGYFSSTLGYDVKTKPKTIIDLHYMVMKYGLTKEGFEEIASVYTRELFEQYDLDEILEKLIFVFGKTDEMFEGFMGYAHSKAKEIDKVYEVESEKLDPYTSEYGERFIKSMKHKVKRAHIKADTIISSLPSAELIKKDEAHLLELAYKTRIYMGLGMPVSHMYIEEYLEDETLSKLGEPRYYITLGGKTEVIDATFTKQEFLDSVKAIKLTKK